MSNSCRAKRWTPDCTFKVDTSHLFHKVTSSAADEFRLCPRHSLPPKCSERRLRASAEVEVRWLTGKPTPPNALRGKKDKKLTAFQIQRGPLKHDIQGLFPPILRHMGFLCLGVGRWLPSGKVAAGPLQLMLLPLPLTPYKPNPGLEVRLEDV